MTMQRWFVTLDGQESGPFDAAQVRSLVQAGRIRPTTPVRREDLARAVPAGSVQGLLPDNDNQNAPVVVSNPTAPANGIMYGTVAPVDTTQVVAKPKSGSNPHKVQRQSASKLPVEDEPAELESHAPPVRAGFGVRILACLIDSALMAVIAGLLWVPGIYMMVMAIPAGIEREAEMRKECQRGGTEYPSSQLEFPGAVVKLKEGEATALKLAESASAALAPKDEELKRFPKNIDLKNEVALLRYEMGIQRTKAEEYSKRRTWMENEEEKIIRSAKQEAEHYLARGATLIFCSFFLFMLFMPMCEGLMSTSPGKRMLGYRIATKRGNRIGIGAALLRQLVRMVPFGQLAMLGQSKLTLHDMASGTQVISGPVDKPSRSTRLTTTRSTQSITQNQPMRRR